VGAPPGLGVVVVAAVVVGATVPVGRSRRDRVGRVLVLLALGLSGVAVRSDSAWLVALCLLASIGTGTLAAARGRTWPSVLLAMPALAMAGLRALPWAGRRLATVPRGAPMLPWVRGTAVGLVVAWVVGALLRSADVAFAHVVRAVVPTVDLGSVPLRMALALMVAAGVLAEGFLVAAAPRWDATASLARRRPAVEWVVPLVLVDAVLASFIAVQAAELFGGDERLLVDGVTYAERARQGFGQLVAVTVVVLLLVSWAARRAGPGGTSARRLLAGLGGGLVLLSLAVVVSAMHRLRLYEEAYGYTVTRVTAGAAEAWLALVLVGVAALWLAGRTAWTAPAVVGSGAAVLMVLAMVSPDQLVARWNVERYLRTGQLDALYLARLSDDAVPALDRLPGEIRGCVLTPAAFGRSGSSHGRGSGADPWYAANLARSRADRILAADPPRPSASCAESLGTASGG
jgi:hypothetical protein